MARRKTAVPKHWREYAQVTRFLPVPQADWLRVKQGIKTELRLIEQMTHLECPTVAVGYVEKAFGGAESLLLVIEESWREPLGAISEESLAREGFPDLDAFRSYWIRERTGERFKPLYEIQVFRVRPFVADDAPTIGLQFLRRLYGEHLPDGLRTDV